MRLYPKNIIPKDVGKVEVQIPTDFDIPNGGEKICEVGHLNHKDLDGQFCEISNERKITVRTNQQTGLNPVCTIVRITTEFSVGNDNGFQAPPVPTLGSFDVYLWDNTQLLEYTADKGAPDAIKLETGKDLNITTSCNEEDEISVVKVSFNAKVQLRAGYDVDEKQTDIFKKIPQGRIELLFNTKDKYNSQGTDGFEEHLGFTASVVGTAYPIPCVGIKNIYPKDNENLICELFRASGTDFYTPARVVVRNFKMLSLDQKDIEFHLLDVLWVRNPNNKGTIEFKGYEVSGDGSVENLYDVTGIDLLGQFDTGVALVTKNYPGEIVGRRPEFSPNLVGASLSLTFYAEVNTYIYQYDSFEFTFPASFEFPKNHKDISAVFKIYTTPYGAANEYFFDAVTTIYE